MTNYTLTAVEDPASGNQKTTMVCIFDGPPSERALLKMIKPLTELDPLTAEEFYALRQSYSQMAYTLNGSFGFKLEETVMIDYFSGEIKKNGGHR